MQTLMIFNILFFNGLVHGRDITTATENETISSDGSVSESELYEIKSKAIETNQPAMSSTTDKALFLRDYFKDLGVVTPTGTGRKQIEIAININYSMVLIGDSSSISEKKEIDEFESNDATTQNPHLQLTTAIITSREGIDTDPKQKPLLYDNKQNLILFNEKNTKSPIENKNGLKTVIRKQGEASNTIPQRKEKTKENQQMAVTQKSNIQTSKPQLSDTILPPYQMTPQTNKDDKIYAMLYLPVILVSLCLFVFILAVTISHAIVQYKRNSLFRFKNLEIAATSV